MPNMAMWGLLKAVGAPCKVHSLCLFQKLKGKNQYFDLYLKKKRVQARKCNFIEIPLFHTDMDSFFGNTCHSHEFLGSIGAKITSLRNFGTNNHFFYANFFLKFFWYNHLISRCGIILHNKLLQHFEVLFGDLSKISPFNVGNDRHFF